MPCRNMHALKYVFRTTVRRFGQVALSEAVDVVFELGHGRTTTVTF